eukprot:scaffold5277_cov404-Prasinococcus_capsulatus_cf.AAC.1
MPWHLAHALSAVLHSMGSSRQDITSVSQPIVAMSRSKGYTASHLRSALTVDPMNGILAHTHHVMLQNTWDASNINSALLTTLSSPTAAWYTMAATYALAYHYRPVHLTR